MLKRFVTLVSARAEVANPAWLRSIGYRYVAPHPTLPGAYYARPWLLWALLKTANAIHGAFTGAPFGGCTGTGSST